MPALQMRAEHRQSQTLSPRLQHAVRLLQMSSLDFAALVRQSLEKNPFLEYEDEGDGDTSPAAGLADMPLYGADSVSAEPGETSIGSQASATALDLASVRELPDDLPDEAFAAPGDEVFETDPGASDRDLWNADIGAAARRGADGALGALDLMPIETMLNTHLQRQLGLCKLQPREALLALVIVESLDDDGYLRTALDSLGELAELAPPATPTEMAQALQTVQSLEPAGVAARSVGECIALQLPALECPRLRSLALRIVEEQLPLLAARDTPRLARALGEPQELVQLACERIRQLDPHPGWRLGSARVAYVIPDVVVHKLRGKWTVQLNPAIVPRIRLNAVYARLYQRHRSEGNAQMGSHLQEARWTLRNVEQRFCTILEVAQAIVKRQRNFFEYGAMAMKPLGLSEIAEEVGVHESTVSRVTNDKFMATPTGVYELKYFFSRAMVTANGSECTGTAIRSLIKDIIAAESPEDPLSDARITQLLAQQGLKVARRTVTKYRQTLRVESVERRRRMAASA